jgi:hypothetical protein
MIVVHDVVVVVVVVVVIVIVVVVIIVFVQVHVDDHFHRTSLYLRPMAFWVMFQLLSAINSGATLLSFNFTPVGVI